MKSMRRADKINVAGGYAAEDGRLPSAPGTAAAAPAVIETGGIYDPVEEAGAGEGRGGAGAEESGEASTSNSHADPSLAGAFVNSSKDQGRETVTQGRYRIVGDKVRFNIRSL